MSTSIFRCSSTFLMCGVQSTRPSTIFEAKSADMRNLGSSVALTLPGFVRDVWRNVPPLLSIVRVFFLSRRRTLCPSLSGSKRLYSSNPPHPRRMPMTSAPLSIARYTTPLIHGFNPGTSPPPVNIPILISVWFLHGHYRRIVLFCIQQHTTNVLTIPPLYKPLPHVTALYDFEMPPNIMVCCLKQ